MEALDRRKRFRAQQNVALEPRKHPKSYICPLTMSVMFDPVLDNEGNSYERKALMQWLEKNQISPVSRQPMSKRLVVPNIALREAIHNHMGPSWVAQKKVDENKSVFRSDTVRSLLREKIGCYLQSVAKELGGLNLVLNKEGCCAFTYQDVTFVLDVPKDMGMFCFYTKGLLPTSIKGSARDRLYAKALELNFLQGMYLHDLVTTTTHKHSPL